MATKQAVAVQASVSIAASDEEARASKYAAYTRPFAEYERAELLRSRMLVSLPHAGEQAECEYCGAKRQVIGASCHICGHDVR